MNILTNTLLVVAFIMALLATKLITISDDKYIVHKLWLFGTVFVWQYIILVLFKVKDSCMINFTEVTRLSAETGAIAIIGYSFYTDLGYNHSEMDDTMKYAYLISIIGGIMFAVASLKQVFGYTPYYCVKKIDSEEKK